MEDEKPIYNLTEKGDSLIPKEIETMDEWLTEMSDEILIAFFRICNKNPDDRSDEEEYTICSHALVLYCRELGLTELGITPELISQIGGSFCANVIIEKLRRSGHVTTDGPLLLYKDCNIKMTEEGRRFMEEQREKGDE